MKELNAKERWQALCEAPQQARRWDWYALLRLIQCAGAERPRIGHGFKLEHDAFRLGQPPFLHPPATDVAALKTEAPHESDAQESPADEGWRRENASAEPAPWIYSYHFGLFGPNGPLPLHMTEWGYRQNMARDRSFTAFCDALHHRFLCFFFRAWADGRKELDWDRHSTEDSKRPEESQRSWWDLYVGSLIGLGLDGVRNRDEIPDHAKLFFAGRLLQPSRNAEGLRAIIEDYFEVTAEVVQFTRRVIQLPANTRTRLRLNAKTGCLGRSIILGKTIEQYQSGFRIRLGPLKFSEFVEFLPKADSKCLGQLHDWVRLYLGNQTDANPEAMVEAAWDLQLVLKAAEVPRLGLRLRLRLGWTTLLITTKPDKDAADLVLSPPLRSAARKESSPTTRVA